MRRQGQCHAVTVSLVLHNFFHLVVYFVQEESKLRQQEEEERRREVSSKFQSTINEITVKMQEHHQRNQALRQENLE